MTAGNRATEPIGNALDEALRKADMYRRQLGGTSAALRRERQRTADLAALVRDLWRDYSWATCDLEENDRTRHALAERARKLGIEVDA